MERSTALQDGCHLRSPTGRHACRPCSLVLTGSPNPTGYDLFPLLMTTTSTSSAHVCVLFHCYWSALLFIWLTRIAPGAHRPAAFDEDEPCTRHMALGEREGNLWSVTWPCLFDA